VKVPVFSLSDVLSVAEAEALYEDEYVLELLGVLLLTPRVRDNGVLEGEVDVAVNEYELCESPSIEAESEPLSDIDETDI
jgi:hypothetical protein